MLKNRQIQFGQLQKLIQAEQRGVAIYSKPFEYLQFEQLQFDKLTLSILTLFNPTLFLKPYSSAIFFHLNVKFYIQVKSFSEK
jgi:hypothetical protein